MRDMSFEVARHPEEKMHRSKWETENLRTGELYAGVILGQAGQPDYHLVLMPGEIGLGTWERAVKGASGRAGDLPTCQEQALLYANLKREFLPAWYWSREQRADKDDYVWSQCFRTGIQSEGNKNGNLRARTVRRILVEVE